MIPSWILIPALFVLLSIFDVALAWNGSHFALLMLAVNVLILAIAYGWWSRHARISVDGWGRSTNGWSAAQKWGMQTDTILREALTELSEFDEEAAIIHSGRATNAGLEYLKTFRDEDSTYVSAAVREELGWNG